jgi:hypothetical protein
MSSIEMINIRRQHPPTPGAARTHKANADRAATAASGWRPTWVEIVGEAAGNAEVARWRGGVELDGTCEAS